jgi:hypothetical protein
MAAGRDIVHEVFDGIRAGVLADRSQIYAEAYAQPGGIVPRLMTST